ncbi:MAG: sulfur carrier protein ThiS [Acidobacteria bacterium]|nr:MAG: sulfur carrier protein ThiS [Acidobacteriota bacterium]
MADTGKVLVVNGESRRVAAGHLVELLRELGYDPEGRGLAVAVDGVVVPRSRWVETVLRPGARVDIVGAVQGG